MRISILEKEDLPFLLSQGSDRSTKLHDLFQHLRFSTVHFNEKSKTHETAKGWKIPTDIAWEKNQNQRSGSRDKKNPDLEIGMWNVSMRRVDNLVPNNFQILAAQPMQNESRIEHNFHLNTKCNTTFEAPNPLEAKRALSQLPVAKPPLVYGSCVGRSVPQSARKWWMQPDLPKQDVTCCLAKFWSLAKSLSSKSFGGLAVSEELELSGAQGVSEK